MSVKDDQKAFEEEKRARVSKIGSYLKAKAEPKAKRKAQPKVEPKTDLKAETKPEPQPAPTPQTLPTENRPISVPVRDASAPNGLRYRPMKAWERWEGNRVVQFRPMTRREREAEEDEKFMSFVRKDDQAHKEEKRKAEEESKRWAKEDRQRREQEERTGMRPWEPGRYISVEEAGKRGYLVENSEG